MLDLPGHPTLDKVSLIGTCSRLPVRVNAVRLQAEVAGLPASSWAGAGGRVGVHRAAQAIFLRGFAPAEGEKPIEDREQLGDLPYVRELITRVIPAPAQRCLLARLPPAGRITGHIDLAPYFAKTIRIHVPVVTNDDAWMYCGGHSFRMQPGEAWALNNSATHGVWNAHATDARTHLICDFLPAPELLALLARAERDLGAENALVDQAMRGRTLIVTDGFVFLHLHKSGGSFVNEFLKRFYPSAREIGYHLPWSLVPASHANLPALGLVRNPWSYYVSWYTFQKQRPRPNALFRLLSDDGRLDFEPTVRNMLDLGTTGARLDALVAALPQGYGDRGLNLPGPALAGIAGSGLGFYAFLYRHMYNGAGRAYFVRMEHLRDELLKMLTGTGQIITGPMREWVASAPAKNVSAHGRYVEYYGTELRDLVAERDAGLIAAHGYRFGELN